MALMLLVASGLMVRTLLAIQRVEPGFTRPDQIQMVRISLPQVLAREPERVIRLQKDIVDKLAAIPGVAAVGFTIRAASREQPQWCGRGSRGHDGSGSDAA